MHHFAVQLVGVHYNLMCVRVVLSVGIVEGRRGHVVGAVLEGTVTVWRVY